MNIQDNKPYRLTGFTVREYVCEDFVHVYANFNTDSGNPLLGNPSYVNKTGWMPSWEKYVSFPNWLERLRGITMKDKLERARVKVSGAADKRIRQHNAKVDMLAGVKQCGR